MSYPREKFCRRQKTCLVVSVFILILGLLQVGFGVLFSIMSRNRKCHKVKHMLVGIYLVIAGIAGIASYCPRKARTPLKGSKANRSRGTIAIFLIFCTLVTVVVLLDNTALNCITSHEVRSHEGSTQVYAILGLAEVTGMHLAHLLCAICIGLACPDLWSLKTKWFNKSDKLLNSSFKQKSKQALHLPEARTHIQEAAGTGDKVTVVSLPESDGIVYAVPEEQYVIRRGEATYMAPAGNTNLTAFFPTYRSQTD